MCAIAGILDLPFDKSAQNNMQQTMKRRGPDGNGIHCDRGCCLLHARLAIIDPQGGKQPMTLPYGNKEYTIVYNGELYNTEQLRKNLMIHGHQFLTHSDTEVLLHAYAQWGEKCLEKLNGIYAFCIWEAESRELFAARDPMGVKPFFYTLHEGGFLFASEIKTILAYPGFHALLDAVGAGEVLLLGPGRTPGSGVLRNIFELEPGCCGRYRAGKWMWRRYWKLQDREHRDSFEKTVEKVRYLVTDSIKRQTVSDVPIGTFLSGGLDSSIITAVCAEELGRNGESLDTFSLDYQDNKKYFVPGKFQPNSDADFIGIMENWLHTRPHWSVLTPYDLMDSLEDATIARDLPGMADVDFSLLHFCGNIRQDVKVALSGECADEIFGGYPWYRDPQVRSLDGFPWAQNTRQRAAFLHPALAEKLNPEEFVRERYEETVTQADILPGTCADERRMKEMVNLNMRWFMQTLLDRKDRMSMYHSLEVRVPFCDHRIAQYLYTVPWHMKDHNGVEKGLLRQAVGDLLPYQISHRKKSPYPKTHHPKYMELVSERLRELLAMRDAPIFSLVDKNVLSSLLDRESVWPWYGQLMRTPQTIAFMLQIDFWLRHYNICLV